jgi:hypothetical protein
MHLCYKHQFITMFKYLITVHTENQTISVGTYITVRESMVAGRMPE